MDRETKMWLVFFWVPAICIFTVVLVWAISRFNDRNDQCVERGGLLIKTSVDGYVCIDKSVLK